MKTGDLVRHTPDPDGVVYNLYKDWGHEAEFTVGIIVNTKNSFAQVMPCNPAPKLRWYQYEELEVVSESR